MFQPRARVVLATFVIGLLFATGSAADHSWGGYHWARTSNPFTLKVGDNVDSKWDAHLDKAIADWSQSTVLNLTEVAGGARPRNCRPTAGRIEACNATYGNTGWLGIAQIWITGGTHITQGITKLNDTYFNTATYNTPAWRQLVTCQEIAHDFGLDHQDENFDNANLGSCMDYTSNPAGNEEPNAHDYDQIEEIYFHLDNTTTIGSVLPSSAPGAMSDLDPEGPGQWGRLTKSSRNGRSQTYELDFGRGNKIVTHVFWADPARDGRGR